MGTGCIDESTVVAFLDGSLPGDQRTTVENHVASCDSCRELTTWAAAELANGRQPVEHEPHLRIGRLAPGSRVDRYQILGVIGRGGMGEVYAAYHPDLDRRIALKVVDEASADSALRRARLLREARAIARLSHRNVIAVHDAGTFDDRVYIAMEFVEGQTVDEWLHAEPRSWRQIVEVFVAAGRGLAAAHAAGVIHRDFKPQNVMIGRDGSVRVMDFGLARLAEEPVEAGEAGKADDDDDDTAAQVRPPIPATVTKTGALVGTLAYMAPEQFRGEPIDARADQFSFCVALHEGVYGRRPALRHLRAAPDGGGARADGDAKAPVTSRTASSPAWLRGVLARGLSEDRSLRFSSMDDLLAAMTRGQTRVRRRTVGLAVGIATVLLAAGAWRVGAARRVSCAVPQDRLAAVWAPRDESNPRRQTIHRAFTASGLATAETAWQRAATALDDYATQWSAMYVNACEATHVRGDQSGEVLDLRMGCLSETLDGVRALTDVLSHANATIVGQAAKAAQDLPPLSQCADVAALRSAVPIPRDRATASAVEQTRSALRDVFALQQVGNQRDALARAREVLPRAEAIGYKPLVAEVLYLIGILESDDQQDDAEKVLERSFVTAESARDDLTAAKAAIGLVFATSFAKEQRHENDQWTRLAHAILDRLPPPQRRLRAWLLNNEASVYMQRREFEAARRLLEEAIALKKEELGPNHPDVWRTALALVWALTELGRPEEALQLADQCLAILTVHDPESVLMAYTFNNRGDALNALGRYREAEGAYGHALRIMRAQLGPTSPIILNPLAGLGAAKLGEGDAAAAVDLLQQGLSLGGKYADAVFVADATFTLARALVASGGDRRRARSLASSAHDTYATHDLPRKQREVAAWLAANGGAGKP